MLKLIKYDFMKIRSLLLGYVAIAALINIVFIISWKMRDVTDGSLFTNLSIISGVLLVICALSLPLFVLIMSISLYSKDISSKKGYMTFLTPNSAYKIIGSKLILSLIILIVAAIVALTVGDYEIRLFLGDDEDFSILYFIKLIYESLDSQLTSVILFFIAAILQFITNILSFYMAIAISYSIMRKGKLNGLISIVAWFAIIMIEGVVTMIGSSVSDGLGLNFRAEGLSVAADVSLPTQMFILWIVFYAIFSTVLYFLTSFLTEKKISL